MRPKLGSTPSVMGGRIHIASKSGKLLGALQVWLVRNGVANLLSLPELERLGFRIMHDTLDEWVVISPKGGARIIFKRDTGRCDRFPFLLCIWIMMSRKLSLMLLANSSAREKLFLSISPPAAIP